MPWVFKDGIPIYQQIIQRMQYEIASGRYVPGEKLPAVRELALEAGVNPNTMQRALSEMEREGLLYTERTSGRFVTTDERALLALRDSLASTCIEDMFTSLRHLGLEGEKALEAIRACQEKQDRKEG